MSGIANRSSLIQIAHLGSRSLIPSLIAIPIPIAVWNAARMEMLMEMLMRMLMEMLMRIRDLDAR
jgi:hypothetical protein